MPFFLRTLPRRATALTAARLLAAATLLVAAFFGLDTQQRKWIFQASVVAPTDGAARWSRDDGIEDVWIDYVPAAGAARLHALWLANDDARAPLLLYLHGARRNVDDSAFRVRQMRDLGFSVLAVDYRGFGRSTDTLPSEESVAEDARAGWDWLHRTHPAAPRYIYGHSLGGAIAVELAAAVPDAKGLIVEGTFTSIADVFRSFRWGWLPVTPLITQPFDSIDRIARVRAPVLVVHGSDDTLIPPTLGRALYDRATAPKRFVLVEGGTHYSTNRVGHDQYREALHALFGLGA